MIESPTLPITSEEKEWRLRDLRNVFQNPNIQMDDVLEWSREQIVPASDHETSLWMFPSGICARLSRRHDKS
jgi:hypothetical protein